MSFRSLLLTSALLRTLLALGLIALLWLALFLAMGGGGAAV